VNEVLLTQLGPGASHSRRETKLHRIALSITMWSRKCPETRRHFLYKSEGPMFSRTSHRLVIQKPPLEIWVKEEVISYQGGCMSQITESRNSRQQFSPPPWCLPTAAWWYTAVKRNLLFRKDISSTGKWSLQYGERMSHSFSHEDTLWSQKSCGSRPGQENGKTLHEDNIISSPHTQWTNDNKYEATGKFASSVKKAS
jgi:hypothetical protein